MSPGGPDVIPRQGGQWPEDGALATWGSQPWGAVLGRTRGSELRVMGAAPPLPSPDLPAAAPPNTKLEEPPQDHFGLSLGCFN